MSAPAHRFGSLSLVVALSFGQIVGWGTTYYMPSALADALQRDLGFSTRTIYFGVTLMVAVAGLSAPLAGRLFDRRGVARALSFGTMLMAGGLFLFAGLPSHTTWYVAWVAFGLAQSLCLTLAAQTLVTRLVATDARRQIGLVAVITALSATIFWPVGSALEATVGWRATVWIYGVVQLVLVLPLHLWIAAAWSDDAGPVEEEPSTDAMRPLADPRRRRIAAILITASFAIQGFASWGLPLHHISLFEAMGLDRVSAVTVAALSGPASIVARGFELFVARRVGPLALTLGAMALIAPAVGIVFAPGPVLWTTVAYVVLWSAANGVLAVLRSTLPLALLGARDFGSLTGSMMLPQNLVFAMAPTAFAVIIDLAGPTGGLLTALTTGILAVAVALPLIGLVAAERREEAARGRDEETGRR
jgi:predicted MFS family arabinose efflux permease